ncbi:MAG: YceI family protein [Saprospiraceae bacterium]
MRNFFLMLACFFACCSNIQAQKYFTKTGQISFYSDTPIEKIEALNKSSNCVMDVETGKIEFAVLVKGFQFDKALMQEHFNENYMESNKYPKATFKGQIDGYQKLDISKNGKSNVHATGDLTIHGVTKKVTTSGVLVVVNGKIDIDATFDVILADYKISIPALVRDQISKTVKIKVDVTLEPLK